MGSAHANVTQQDETELIKASTETYLPCTSLGREETENENEVAAPEYHLGTVVENVVVHIAGTV